jgi:hypothetical protein
VSNQNLLPLGRIVPAQAAVSLGIELSLIAEDSSF